MISSDSQVLVSDFGISVHEADTPITDAGTVIGSLEYVAPERFHGDGRRSASDLFSWA